MRNKRLILALTGAVICGLLAVLLVTRYLASVQTFQKDLNNVVVAKTEIPVGAKITVEQVVLLPMPNGSAPEGVIPEGYRAMTVRVDDVVGVSGFVAAGSYVDVVAVIVPVNTAAAAQGPISKIVLQNIKVLASGA